MELRALVKEASQMLDAAMEEEASAFFLTVHVSEGEGEDEDDRTQMVMIEQDEEGELAIVSTDVGPFSEDMDLPEVLRLMRDAVFCRVYVGEPSPEGGEEQLVVEATTVKEKLDVELLASMIQEVAEVADELEVLLFDEEEGDEDDEEEGDE
ncbi:MAG: hypothetical protein ACXWUG_13935 [Polyangiales bacterium]